MSRSLNPPSSFATVDPLLPISAVHIGSHGDRRVSVARSLRAPPPVLGPVLSALAAMDCDEGLPPARVVGRRLCIGWVGLGALRLLHQTSVCVFIGRCKGVADVVAASG